MDYVGAYGMFSISLYYGGDRKDLKGLKLKGLELKGLDFLSLSGCRITEVNADYTLVVQPMIQGADGRLEKDVGSQVRIRQGQFMSAPNLEPIMIREDDFLEAPVCLPR